MRVESTVYPWCAFLVVVALILVLQPFPSLYGDEYGSLEESGDLSLNPAPIGYFVQLKLVRKLGDADDLLRCLSIVWAGVALYGTSRWLKAEAIAESDQRRILLLLATNPFLWVYGPQVRFYSYFLATSVLVLWRFRVWQQEASGTNLGWLLCSLLLLCTSHFFSLLVVTAVVAASGWARLGRRRYLLAVIALAGLLALQLPPVREGLMLALQRLTNQPLTPGVSGRGGVGLAALAKLILIPYFFALGERVYPGWWWLTVPSFGLVLTALLLGFWRLRRLPGLNVLIAFLLLQILVVLLVVEPNAPSDAAGAAPRYVIFALPAFLVLVGLGAGSRTWLAWGVIGVNLVGLGGLFLAQWSYGQSDLVNWREELHNVVRDGETACILVDGRANEPVKRYGSRGGHVVHDLALGETRPERIVIASNDYRSAMHEAVDQASLSLAGDYHLVTNRTRFPFQISVYDRQPSGTLVDLFPSRLGLAEQDVRLPLRVEPEGWDLTGYMRLDRERRELFLPARLSNRAFWVASCYRNEAPLASGTPVAELVFEASDGGCLPLVLRAQEETASWDADSPRCRLLAAWTKRVHLVGTLRYPGAYSQHRAAVWGTACAAVGGDVQRVRVRYLLDQGAFYFWGLFGSGKDPN